MGCEERQIKNPSGKILQKARLLKSKPLLSIFLFFFLPVFCFSQSDMVFDHIAVNEGIIQGVVTSIHRDSRNFMWFGTMNGLNRYDGVNFRRFESYSYDSTSLTTGDIRQIYEDKNNNLWVGTSNGLNLFNYKKENFKRLFHDNARKNSLADNFIVNISEDSKGRLWVVTNYGISQYIPGTNSFNNYYLPEKGAKIEASFELNSDTIFLYSNGKVLQFMTEDSSFRVLAKDLKAKEVNVIYVNHQNEIWLGTETDGAYCLDSKGTLTHFSPGERSGKGLESISIQNINPDSKGNLWFSTRNGLYRFREKEKIFTKYQYEYGNPKSLLSSYSKVFYEDKQGIIWVGTVGGVNKFDPGKDGFQTL